MRFLIAGLGSVGRRHLRNLVTLGEREVVLFRTGKSTLPDDELEGYPVEHDLEAALGRRPDAVIVANPTALHLDVAVPAARAGCHLLIEKPVSHSMERIDELVGAVREADVRVLVGYQYRFHPGLVELRSMIRDGRLGSIRTAQASYAEYLPGWHPWEDFHTGYSARSDLGGGVSLTLSHPIDYLRWLLGEARSVGGTCGNVGGLDVTVDDYADLFFRFQDGSAASVHLDYYRRPPSHWVEVTGDRGTVRCDLLEGTITASPGIERAQPEATPFERNAMFLAEMRHFLKVCLGEEEPRCTLEDGIAALRSVLEVQADRGPTRSESRHHDRR